MDTSMDKMQRKLYIKLYDRMIKDLVNEIIDKNIILDPDYQRNYVWNNSKASLLIESVLLNIPIPVIYASEDLNGKWIIVDGLQRLYSLQRYFNDDFKLVGLETLPELNGLKFSKLDESIQKRLERGELRLIVLQNDSDPNIQFDIFMRLNTGAVKLNEQELRNCLYRGALNSLIKQIVKDNKAVEKMIPNKTDRMLANELILRYLAVSEHYNKIENKIKNYDGRIKNLINGYMKEHQNDPEDMLKIIREKFEMQIEKAYSVLGSNGFKKNIRTTKPNASLYECIMIGFEDYALNDLLDKKDSIKAMIDKLLNDQEFLRTIDKATGNTEVMNSRIARFITELKEVMLNAI